MAFDIKTYNLARGKDASEEVYTEWFDDDPTTTSLEVEQPHLGTEAVTIYLDYAKGDEDSLVLSFKTTLFNDEGTGNAYTISYLDATNHVVPRTMVIDQTGTYRIPVAVAIREKSILINFELSGGTDGNRGNVNAYVHP